MALGTTDISVTLVKNTLAANTTAVSGLCTFPTINNWSRYKPVTGTWPQAVDGKFGLVLSGWGYNHPTSIFRLGDFRGYQHTGIMPVIYSLFDNRVPSVLYPSGTITTAVFGVKANSTNNTTRIQPVDLGIQDYYFGVRYRVTGDTNYFWWYKTGSIVHDITEGGNPTIDIDVTVTVTGNVGVFNNAPLTATGTATVELFICSTQCTNWTTTAPPIIYLLPSEIVNEVQVVNSYSFVVSGWTVVSNYTMFWAGSATGYGNFQSTVVVTSGAYFTIGSKPSWLTVTDWRAGGQINTGDWLSGDELRCYPTVANTGLTRYDYIVIGDQEIFCEFQGGTPTVSYSSSPIVINSAIPTTLNAGAGSVAIQFHIVSGLSPTVNVPLYIRLYNTTTSTYLGSWTTVNTHDGQIVNATLGTFISSDINYGNVYIIFLSTVDPLL